MLRPDITMPIARIAATKMKTHPLPLRLSYIEMYIDMKVKTTPGKGSAQAGIELLGSRKPEADAEVIALAVESLLELGLSAFQIDIGQVEFFKGLVEEAGLNEEQSEGLRHLIDQKNSLALEMQLKELNITADTKTIYSRFPCCLEIKKLYNLQWHLQVQSVVLKPSKILIRFINSWRGMACPNILQLI